MSADESLERLRRLKMEARHTGGPERIDARRRSGAASARERVLRLLDVNTFVELDVFVRGAVTGHGKIEGRDVYIFSQDAEAASQTSPDAFARKVAKVVDLAMKNGAPLVGLYDSGVAGLADGAPLGGCAGLHFSKVMASGLVPQIAAVMGPCAGSATFSPALADFVVMVKGSSRLYLADPAATGGVAAGADAAGAGDGRIAYEELGGARAHSEISGLAHLAADDEDECIEMIRGLLSYLPQNNLEEPPRSDLFDPAGRMDSELDTLAICDPGAPCDMRDVVVHVVDEGEFFEVTSGWAENLVTGFARLGGRPVGIVGNQPTRLDGRLDFDAAIKAARFVRFCDAFNVPLVTFEDVPGFLPGTMQEFGGIIRHGAKLLYAFAEATVPKVTVIARKAYGGAYCVMASKHIRTDLNLAWPTAEIAVMGPEGAVNILYKRELDGAADREALRAAKVGEFREKFANPFVAAARGFIDEVIRPRTTRRRLIAALAALETKRDKNPPKKHGNIPL